MSKTTIVEHLRGSNPFTPDYLTAEIASPMRIRYTICGLQENTPIIVLLCAPIPIWCFA